MISGSLLAQEVTNTPAAPASNNAALPMPVEAAPSPAAVAPTPKPAPKKAPAKSTTAKKPETKKAETKKAAPAKKPLPRTADLRTVPLVPGPAVVVANNVNVRGQAKLNSEVVAKLTKGQPVTVIEEIVLKNSGPDEPSAWARIALPPGTHVWVHSQFVDRANRTVSSKRLNLRSGPGENFSILGRVEKGEGLKEVGSKGDWIEIEPPANTHAFVAAQYLKQEGPAAPPLVAAAPRTTPTTSTPPAAPPATATVTEPPKVAAAPSTAPAISPSTVSPPAETSTTPGAGQPNVTTGLAPGEVEMKPVPADIAPPRVVQREGVVRATGSIQAPTQFALVSSTTRRIINYLYTSSPNLDLARYKGMHIIVTGEEYMDERWVNTPMLAIQQIEVQGEK